MTQEDNIKEKIEKLENQIDDRNDKSVKRKILSLPRSVLGYVKKSNGFLTSEGKYLSKPEWHAVAIPAGMISGGFMLPQPLGLVTFLVYLLMNKRGFDLLQSDYEGHWNDVMEEYAYAAASFGITIAHWTYLTQETIGGAGDVNAVLTRLLIGA